MTTYHKTAGLGLALLFALLPGGMASAQSYTVPYQTYQTQGQSTAELYARVQALLQELQQLQLQLTMLQGGNQNLPMFPPALQQAGQNCFPSGHGTLLCYTAGSPYFAGNNYGYGTGDVRSIEADLDGHSAEVRVEYRSGRDDEFLIGGVDTKDEVIEFLADELDESESYVRSIIDWNGSFSSNNDDVDTIEVDIRNGDAHVRVEYDDGDTDTFTIDNETNHNDIIEEIADELDIDEDEVRDIIDWNGSSNNDDVDRIDVEIDESSNDADARVEYEDGDVDHFYYDTDDEDDIISELADDLDMDENDVEDIIDFDYVD